MKKSAARMATAWILGGLAVATASVIAVSYFSSKPAGGGGGPPPPGTKSWKLATTLNPGDQVRASYPLGTTLTDQAIKSALQVQVTAGLLGAFNVYAPGDILPTDWPADDSNTSQSPNGRAATSWKFETTSVVAINLATFPINPITVWVYS